MIKYDAIKNLCLFEPRMNAKKRTKRHPLSKVDTRQNHSISRERMFNEHIIGRLKRFRIVSERYRNRRKRFALRFNLTAKICSFKFKI